MNAPNEPLVFNPLLDFSGLPRFGEITPEHVAPAVDTLLADARATIERVAAAAAAPAWENFVLPLAAVHDRLDRAWGQVAHLNAVVNTPALRKAYNASLPKVSSFHSEFAQAPLATFLAAATQPAITATNRLRCFLPTPTARSRKRAGFRARPAHGSGTRSWCAAAAGRRSSRLSPSAAGRHKSMPY